MVAKRVISALILIGVIAAAIYIDWNGLTTFTVCGLIVTIFTMLGLYEFFTMLEHKGINIYKYVGIGMGAVLPLSIVFRFEPTKKGELILIGAVILILILMQFRRRNNSGVVVNISTTLFGILYVSWFFSFLIKIIYLPSGMALLATILLITKGGDIGAYLIGLRFGRTPLMPRISPKKTVEGSIGGIFFSVLGALAGNYFLNFSYPHIIALGVIFGIIGQLGDLSESLIKRDCEVKDSGKIIPGMGGILDEIDSLLFTAPVFYFYVSNSIK